MAKHLVCIQGSIRNLEQRGAGCPREEGSGAGLWKSRRRGLWGGWSRTSIWVEGESGLVRLEFALAFYCCVTS